ncbi:MAG: hypothetical protein QM639_05525 [Rhodocyclaceae bacterium]
MTARKQMLIVSASLVACLAGMGGGALLAYADYTKTRREAALADDRAPRSPAQAITEFAIARRGAERGGNGHDLCTRAGAVATAFLQDHDIGSYLEWKKKERAYCHPSQAHR